MNSYEKFKQAVLANKERKFIELKKEVKIVEKAIENFLEKILESTTIVSERDNQMSII